MIKNGFFSLISFARIAINNYNEHKMKQINLSRKLSKNNVSFRGEGGAKPKTNLD